MQVQATAQANLGDSMNLYDLYTDALEKVAKNVPTSPEKWARAKAQARAKFDVYPSAYANGWAAKKYKSMGGGWKKEAEAKLDFPANDYGKAAAMRAIRGKSEAEKKRERRGIALAVGVPLAMVAGGTLHERMKKKAELDKEALLPLLGRVALGAGKMLAKGGRRFAFGKKGIGKVKAAKHAYKRAGQVSTVAGVAGAVGSGVKAINQKVAPTTPPKSAAAAPDVNTPKPPPSI